MSATIFGIRPNKRVEVIIDGVHLYNLSRQLGFEIDYASLRTLILEEYDGRRFNYIMKVIYDDDGAIQQPTIAKMLDFMRYNGFNTVIAEAVQYTTQEGRHVLRQNVDVIVACAMLRAASDRIDEILLFAGSDDLLPAIITAREMGARVTVISSKSATSNDFRAEADWFIDLSDPKTKIKDKITRREREPREPYNPARIPVELPNVIANGAVVVEDRRDTALGSRMRVSPSRRTS